MSHSNLPSSHSPQQNSRVGLVSVIVIGAIGLALVLAYFFVSFDSNRISLSQPTAEIEVDALPESDVATEPKESLESEVTLESEEEIDTVAENESEIAEVANTESTTETPDTPEAEGESPSDLDIIRVEPDGSTLIAGRCRSQMLRLKLCLAILFLEKLSQINLVLLFSYLMINCRLEAMN